MKYTNALKYAFLIAAGLLTSTTGMANNSIRQTVEMIQFGTGVPQRGAAVLTRKRDGLSLSISTMDLNPDSTYSVWWVLFNEPEDCLEPYLCGGADVFDAPGVLSAIQVPAVKMSATFAVGFLTGSDGVANFTAELDDGMVPTGTFIDNGWSTPVSFGPDNNAGLLRNNGLKAEVHMVLRSHGPAVAGSVGDQTTTFNGLCDVQECSNVQAAIFRTPESQLPGYCIDTDGDGWGWTGTESCRIDMQ